MVTNKTLTERDPYTCKCDTDSTSHIEMYAFCKLVESKNLFRVIKYFQIF